MDILNNKVDDLKDLLIEDILDIVKILNMFLKTLI